MDADLLQDFEVRLAWHDEDPALIEPRLEAYRAKERAVKAADIHLINWADARLAELEKLR